MNSKLLAILSVLTIVILAVAIFAYSNRGISHGEARSDLLYATLADTINSVERVDVVAADASFSLQYVDDGWGMVDKNGYPAEFEKIQAALVALTQLKIVEPKTSNPKHYDKLGVNDPEEDGASSMRLTLTNGDGAELASLIIGNESFHGRTQRQFVRKAGDPQSWLVEGRLPIDNDPLTWLNREILRIPHDRVQSAVVTHPGDEPQLSVHRATSAVTNFLVDDVPAGFELTHVTAGNILRSAIGFLRFDDVAPEAEHPHDPATLVTSEFRTFDGLIVIVHTSEDGEDSWATFEARAFDPEVTGDAPEESQTTDPEAMALHKIDEITERCSGWIFKLGQGQAANLRKKMSDLTKPLAPPAAAAPLEAAPVTAPRMAPASTPEG